jgi:hypothetical protein
MPLRRSTDHQPIIDLDILTVRFPLTDGKQIVWGEVSDLALRERAIRDEVKDGLEKRALFDRYRSVLEMLASELFDDRKSMTAADGATVVRVTNGML